VSGGVEVKILGYLIYGAAIKSYARVNSFGSFSYHGESDVFPSMQAALGAIENAARSGGVGGSYLGPLEIHKQVETTATTTKIALEPVG
jgi:hypothetical protein